MASTVKHKRGTRSALNALRDAGMLVPWQIYSLTDEDGKLCIATAAGAYTAFARDDQAASGWATLIISSNAVTQPIGAGFDRIMFGTDPTTDSHNGWDKAQSIYTVQQAGIYEIATSLRLADNFGAYSFGHGVDIAQQDSPTFKWDTFPANTAGGYNRFTQLNLRYRSCVVGDPLRMFGYIDGPATVPAAVSLTILRVR